MVATVRQLLTLLLLVMLGSGAVAGCTKSDSGPGAEGPQEPGRTTDFPTASSTTSTSPAPPPPASGRQPPQTDPASPRDTTTPHPVGFRTAYAYPDGVSVKVTKIRRTQAAGRLRTTTRHSVKQGSPIQVLLVRITNGSDHPLDVTAHAAMRYGPKNHKAPEIRNGDAAALSGSLPTGASRTGKLTFAVPTKHLHQATLRLSWTASHSPAVFSGSLGYTPSNGVLFNDPTGSKADQLRITRHIERSIDGAPPGSTIRIVQYSFDIESAAKKLVAAFERGVHIQMIVDQHDQIVTKQTTTLIDLLGSNRKKNSFLVRCGASCMSNRVSTMHAKYYLFSQVGSAKMVSMVGSANITHTNSKGSWNDMQTFVGDAVLYDSLRRYFNDMAPDHNNRNYYRTTTSGPVTLYFFPRAKKHRVLLLQALDGVTCSGAAPGYGKNGHTVVQVTMYSWRVPRIDIAKKLWRLHDAGCRVQIILNRSRTDLAVKQVLARRSAKHGVMDLYDAWVDRNGNNVAERYMHQKGITISGVWNGRPDAKVVYSGSQNFAPLSTTDNNELVLRKVDDATYDAYARNFRYAVQHGTRRLF